MRELVWTTRAACIIVSNSANRAGQRSRRDLSAGVAETALVVAVKRAQARVAQAAEFCSDPWSRASVHAVRFDVLYYTRRDVDAAKCTDLLHAGGAGHVDLGEEAANDIDPHK